MSPVERSGAELVRGSRGRECACPAAPASARLALPAGTGTFGRVQLVRQKTAACFFALKVMSIPDVIRLKQEQHVHNEKSVLSEVSHSFLVKL